MSGLLRERAGVPVTMVLAMLPRPLAAAFVVLGLLVAVNGSTLTAGAAAQIPADAIVNNPIRIPALAGTPDGRLTTRVTYTGATARAQTATSQPIGLTKGFRYRLTTCLVYHVSGSTPVTACTDRSVDTHAATRPVLAAAPTVEQVQRRPGAGQAWAYFVGYTQVSYSTGTDFTVVAHSWPDNGLQGAAIAVPPVGHHRARLPANGPVTPDVVATGEINTARADSICRATPGAADGRLPPGVAASHPAYRRAPAYYEVGQPSGAFAGQPPRGIMLVINGGGWSYTGAGAVQSDRPVADRWRARGWQTVNLTYRACGQSLDDVLWFYDQTRSWFGPSAVVCASGASAGGHLALMMASKRKGVYCVVSQGGPTDLTAAQHEATYRSTSAQGTGQSGGRLHNLGAAAFGAENLAAVSPVVLASSYLKNTRVLQGFALADPLVPYQQATDLQQAMLRANPKAYVDTVQLAKGPERFVHATVSRAALSDFLAREQRLVAPITAPCASTPPAAPAAPR